MVTVILAAKGTGLVFTKLKQPAVIGEVVAGILLGPSALGRLAPATMHVLFPSELMPSLGLFAQLGVACFMFLVGLDLDPGHFAHRARSSLVIANASVLVPFALGFGLATLAYQHYAPAGVTLLPFAMFFGIALAVTALPVLARVLTDLKLERSAVGIMALSCAAIDDVMGWCLLAVVLGCRSGDLSTAMTTVGLTALFCGATVWLLRPLIKIYAAKVEKDGLTTGQLTLCLVVILTAGLCTERIGIHALFGPFLIGAMVPAQSRAAHEIKMRLGSFIMILLLPLFFAFAGLRTQIGLVTSAYDWLWCAVIIAVATLGKTGSTAVAARATGHSWRDATALGILMNTRGLMELIVLNLGLDLGILSPVLFTMLVIMAVATTMMTAPMLQWLGFRGETAPHSGRSGASKSTAVSLPSALGRSSGLITTRLGKGVEKA